MRKGCSGTSKIAILPQFLTIEPHFVRKCSRFVTPRRHHPRPKERKIKKARERKGESEREREREKMWRWEGVREGVKMKVWEKVWRGADVKRSRCEDEKVWRWEDVKMRRCEDEQMWRWEGVKMRRCKEEGVKIRRWEDEKVWRWWRWEDVKMRRWEDEQMWRWEGVREGVKMRRWDTDPHYWKNPALRRSRELLRNCNLPKTATQCDQNSLWVSCYQKKLCNVPLCVCVLVLFVLWVLDCFLFVPEFQQSITDWCHFLIKPSPKGQWLVKETKEQLQQDKREPLQIPVSCVWWRLQLHTWQHRHLRQPLRVSPRHPSSTGLRQTGQSQWPSNQPSMQEPCST